MARAYADDHGLELDDELTYRDIGVSAFRGKNAKIGALRVFLDAVADGMIPAGSYLLVESLDRISRQEILSAQGLFLQIIGAGIRLVTLMDSRCYSIDGINANPYDLIISLVTMMRANEESTTKARRLRAAWSAKRAMAQQKPMTGACPAWVRLNKRTQRFEIRQRQADVVRRIFQDTAAGTGQHLIARALNAEKIPVFGVGRKRGLYWHRSFVAQIQQSPAVVGIMVPHITNFSGTQRKLEKQKPIPGYFPAVVDEALYERVQAIRAKTKSAWTAKVGAPKPTRNVLARLARCPRCDGSMMLVTSGDLNWRYLQCFRANAGAGCVRQSMRYPEVEAAIINGAAEMVTDRISAAARTAALIPGPGMTARLRELRVSALDAPTNLTRLNEALRALINGVTVDRERNRLSFVWRDGSRSLLNNVWQ